MCGRNSQPNYVILDNDEELLTFPTSYDLNTENFLRFLRVGKRHYKDKRLKTTGSAEGISNDNKETLE